MRIAGAIAIGLTLTGAVEAADSPARQPPRRAHPMHVTATAYCHEGRTASGVRTRSGIVAADPRVIPVGSVVKILDGPTAGIYTVMDTGSAIKGRRIDVYLPSCTRAKAFGRRTVGVIVMRHGWNPTITAPQ